MAALTADTTKYSAKALTRAEGIVMNFPVAASTVIYKGGFVGLNPAGNLKMYAAPTVGTTLVGGDRFVGLALEHIASQTAAGDKNCEVLVYGCFEGALGSATIFDQGAAVFASDDNTLTQAALGNAFVGNVLSLTRAGVVNVLLDGYFLEGSLIQGRTPIIASAAANLVSVIHPTENPNGLAILGGWGYTTTGFGGAAIYTLQDTAATTTGVTFTAAATTATGDLIQSSTTTLIQGA